MLRQTSVSLQRCISLELAKSHLRVDQNIEDELITGYLDAAIEACAIYTNRVLNQADWQASFGAWPACGFFELPIAPIVSVDAVKYFDVDGDEITVNAALWDFVSTPGGGRVYLLEDFTNPELRDLPPDQIYVELVAGHDADDGSSGDDPELHLPKAIRSAILLTVGHLYQNRESVIAGRGAAVLPQGAQYLLDFKKIYR